SFPAALAALDRAFFDCEVQPILDRKCAFLACHGNRQQPLRLYSMGKLRSIENPTLEQRSNTPLTDDERAANYESTRAIALSTVTQGQSFSLLILKPLDTSGNGAAHVGGRLFDPEAPDLLTLLAWT